jgi:ABC-type multidrug transport system permease subunit
VDCGQKICEPLGKAKRSFLRTTTSRFVAEMFIKNTKNTIISIIIIIVMMIIIIIIINNMCAYGMYVARKTRIQAFQPAAAV